MDDMETLYALWEYGDDGGTIGILIFRDKEGIDLWLLIDTEGLISSQKSDRIFIDGTEYQLIWL
jgi:hypothetical protein